MIEDLSLFFERFHVHISAVDFWQGLKGVNHPVGYSMDFLQ
jgi:hypothetical protein